MLCLRLFRVDSHRVEECTKLEAHADGDTALKIELVSDPGPAMPRDLSRTPRPSLEYPKHNRHLVDPPTVPDDIPSTWQGHWSRLANTSAPPLMLRWQQLCRDVMNVGLDIKPRRLNGFSHFNKTFGTKTLLVNQF